MDTDPNPKDKIQWLFRLGIHGLHYRVLGLFLYIVVIKYLDQCLERPCKAFKKGMEVNKKMQFQQTIL